MNNFFTPAEELLKDPLRSTETNIAQTDKPDVIILDLSLPGRGGYHVMERLKSSVPLASVPIIVLTAGDAIINEEEALKKRAEAFFLKPFDNSQ